MPDAGRRAARAVRLRELFASAVETPAARRDAWLAEQTGDDPSLLDELRSLLAADADAARIFSSPGSTAAASFKTADQVRPSLPPDGRIAHYRLDQFLGEGGMGHVFKAWDLALDRPAAVKVIRPDVERTQTMRLLREVQASARLQHPAIATFFEGGEERGIVYLAMELVEGTTLRRQLQRGPIAPPQALAILTGLLEALAHAHAAGLLHRDIKPENVMIAPNGRPKLLDFGIARSLSPGFSSNTTLIDRETSLRAGATRTVGAAGTPGYMSPEQLRGEMLTPASDVFQIGALAYEMLTGQRAFGGGSTVAKIAATMAGPPDLTPLARMTPAGLGSMIATALAPVPADRFDSAAAFLRQVDAIVDGRLRHALPESLVIASIVSPDGANHAGEWIGRAIADTLRTYLTRLQQIKVADPPRAAETKDPIQLALSIGVRWLLTGRWQQDGEQLRVTFQLLDAATGDEVRVWESIGPIGQILSEPAALAEPIVEALGLRSPEPPARTVREARVVELHSTARQLWHTGNRDAHARVFPLLHEALTLAPDFLPALTLLAAARATSFIASRDPADLESALAAADRALAIDDGCAEAWSWRAYTLLRQQRVDEALLAYERATRAGDDSTSSYLYGSTLASLGRYEDALAHLQRAVTLEPRHGIGWLSLGWTLHSLRRGEAARFALNRARSLEGQPGPTFVAGVGGYLAECLRIMGDVNGARAEALQGLESIERSDHSYRDTIRAFCLGALGRAALATGDSEGARAAFSQAVAQMRSRTLTLAGGHVFVQALAGLSRAGRDESLLREAMVTYDSRQGYSFNFFFGCGDDTTAFELATAAEEFRLSGDATRLLARARAAGNRHPFLHSQSQ